MINIHVTTAPLRYASRIQKITKSLLTMGIVKRVIVVGSSDGDDSVKREVAYGNSSTITIARVKSHNRTVRLVGMAFWNCKLFIRLIGTRVGMINCHNISCLPACICLKIVNGALLVYEPHELETETSRAVAYMKPAARLFERFLILFTNKVILVGEEIENWYKKKYKLKNTAVIMNCPPFSLPKHNNEFRRVFPIEEDKPIFLYQGIIGHGRGIDKLIAAFDGMRNEAALVLMGYGSVNDFNQAKMRQSQNIFVHDAVSTMELARYTESADFGLSFIEPISLSYQYCVPNKLFQYIMAGKPVLVSPTMEQAKIVCRYNLGVVAEDLSIESIRRCVYTLIASNLTDFQPGIEEARQKYCWERQEEKLKQIYCELVVQK